MITESGTWRDYISIPMIIALAGCGLFFAGTFFEIGVITVFGHSLSFRLSDLGISNEIMISRALSLAGAAVLFLPKRWKALYSLCGLGQFVLFAPKAFYVLRHISSASKLLQALGVSNYIRIEDYLKYSFGYYSLIAGTLIVLGCSVYLAVSLYRKTEN